MSQRVLITGALGFTGRYVCDALAHAGWEVWGTGHQLPGEEFPVGLAHYRRCDISDRAALRALISEVQPGSVLHLAAIAFVGHGSAEDFYRVNLIGTRNLLEAIDATSQRIESIVLASSANVYGNGSSGAITEERPGNPANDYAVSKLAMEYMARLWFDRLPILLVRPFNYTGVGQSERFLLPKIVAHIRRRAEFIELGNLDVARDFSDVRFVANAYRRLLESKCSSETVNICSGAPTSLKEVLVLAEEISGHRIEVRVNPDFVRTNEVKSLCGDPSRLKEITGVHDPRALGDTLRWMIEAP
ncbi:MAG: GDP-mannose 4,6-dehydratase [Pseudomonadota bacterium]